MAAPFDFSGYIWMFAFFITIIVSAIAAVVHEFVLLPKIARMMRKARWSKAVVAFIQDDTGNVNFTTSDKELPEGVIHNQRGWFLLPRPSAIPNSQIEEVVKRGRGRPPKEQTPPEGIDVSVVPTDAKAQVKPSKEDFKKIIEAKQRDVAEQIMLHGKMIHVPLLRGLGKQVFFGSTSSAMLTNLFTISHADLLESRRLIPMNTQKTQLDALATGSRIEGMKMMGQDVIRWIFYVIIAVIPIAVIGLVFWFLTQGSAA